MKKTKLSMLALAVMAGGVMAASAAAETFTAYDMTGTFTNAEAVYWVASSPLSTTNPPSATAPAVSAYMVFFQDGAGKITGSGGVIVYYNPSNAAPVSEYSVDVKGKISAKTAGAPTLVLTLKGQGFTADANGAATASSITLKFTGSTPNTTAPSTIQGTLDITIKNAKTAAAGSFKLKAVAGYAVRASANSANISADVVQGSKGKMIIGSEVARGTGKVKSGSYTIKAKGIGFGNKGAVYTVTGTEGSVTNAVGTNNVVFQAPTTAVLDVKKSKQDGQVIGGTAATVTDTLDND